MLTPGPQPGPMKSDPVGVGPRHPYVTFADTPLSWRAAALVYPATVSPWAGGSVLTAL